MTPNSNCTSIYSTPILTSPIHHQQNLNYKGGIGKVLTAFPKVYDPHTATKVLRTTIDVVVDEDSLSITSPWSLTRFCLRSSDLVVASSSMLSPNFTLFSVCVWHAFECACEREIKWGIYQWDKHEFVERLTDVENWKLVEKNVLKNKVISAITSN